MQDTVHFEIDLNIDGAQVFNNSEQPGIIPILAVIYSVNRSANSSEESVVIQLRHPFIIGFFLNKSKPDLTKFLNPLFAELNRLCPNNDDLEKTEGREFTASLRCVIADGPMRAYLKKCKDHSGYWSCERCIQKGASRLVSGNKKDIIEFRELNAPPRLDEDFADYCKSDECEDELIANPHKLGPFLWIWFLCSIWVCYRPDAHYECGRFWQKTSGNCLKTERRKIGVWPAKTNRLPNQNVPGL